MIVMIRLGIVIVMIRLGIVIVMIRLGIVIVMIRLGIVIVMIRLGIVIVMIRLGIISHRHLFSKIKSSLKLLSITPPTTKKQIKKKYLEMAKSLHPDIKEEDGKVKSADQIN